MNYQNSNSRRINHSQGRNISDYNNTLSLNRSMVNNNYSNNTPMRSRRSPLQLDQNNTLRHSNMDDLEYLMSLKDGRHGDMTQKEWEEYNRKLHYMNDVSYIYNIINNFIEICLW